MDPALGHFYSRVFLAVFSHLQAIFSSMNGDGMDFSSMDGVGDGIEYPTCVMQYAYYAA